MTPYVPHPLTTLQKKTSERRCLANTDLLSKHFQFTDKILHLFKGWLIKLGATPHQVSFAALQLFNSRSGVSDGAEEYNVAPEGGYALKGVRVVVNERGEPLLNAETEAKQIAKEIMSFILTRMPVTH
eukprot:CAMPEP_0178712284 /NCGR_PEP_ID=MMETSP0699-20121125/18801_1 /TAXON_ID=265572 /ORGANISM="Extubocellulus spinifer, Strain CCMP396" /LENGTH=127 /DNA_ID=CAMNT_0020361027 /DNA_START=765 /DNA_END=1149 /DNA_ORIENTATION=-